MAVGDVTLEVQPPLNPELVPVGWGVAENEHQENLEHRKIHNVYGIYTDNMNICVYKLCLLAVE